MASITFELPVYTFQIDFAQHVSNIVYVQWMEIGRLRILEEAGLPPQTALETGLLPTLAETRIRYRRPILLGESVMAETWIEELGAATAHIAHRFSIDGGTLCAEGLQRGLFVDQATGKPARLSPEMRARFEPFVGRS